MRATAADSATLCRADRGEALGMPGGRGVARFGAKRGAELSWMVPAWAKSFAARGSGSLALLGLGLSVRLDGSVAAGSRCYIAGR